MNQTLYSNKYMRFILPFQNLFIQSSDPSMLAQNTEEITLDPGEKPYNLEEYSYDHFR